MDFRKATDILFKGATHADLAKVLSVSVPLIRQARLGEQAKAHRSAPAGWEKAVARLAEQMVTRYGRLAKELGGR